MNHCCRLVVAVGILSASITVGSRVRPEAGLGPSAWLEAQQKLASEHRRGTNLAEQTQRAHQRLQAQTRVLAQLHDYQLTLAEAAARFRDLTDPRDVWNHLIHQVHPGQSDEECWCRRVIEFMRRRDSAETGGWRRSDELEEELGQLLAKGLLQLNTDSVAGAHHNGQPQ
jgi:hypothetical protein